jgi:hypothetical protein
MFTAKACIHSLDGRLDDVVIFEHVNNNHVIAWYKGHRCTAVFNPFVGRYYVDDVYGVLDSEEAAQ